MVRTIITPENTDIHLLIPENYVGKTVEVTLLVLDELEQYTPASPCRMTVGELKAEVEQAVAEYENGLYTTQEELERRIESW
ncbi:MAG: hypothetical protein LBC47_05320 [Tannerella sp.]|jgi:hypothetical protein|nr:hypothetical protein [Tannerella sp.]